VDEKSLKDGEKRRGRDGEGTILLPHKGWLSAHGLDPERFFSKWRERAGIEPTRQGVRHFGDLVT